MVSWNMRQGVAKLEGRVNVSPTPCLTIQWSGRPTACAFWPMPSSVSCGPPLTGGVKPRDKGADTPRDLLPIYPSLHDL